MQALIIDARLSFSIGQRCLALDHTLGEPASQNGRATGGIVDAHALSPYASLQIRNGAGKTVTVRAKSKRSGQNRNGQGKTLTVRANP